MTGEREIMQQFPLLYRHKLRYGFECGDGWATLIKQLSAQLEPLIAELPAVDQRDTYAAHVKQKFGGLRFYMTTPSYAMYQAIAEAEAVSLRTCEACGAPGKLNQRDSWLYVSCESHRQ